MLKHGCRTIGAKLLKKNHPTNRNLNIDKLSSKETLGCDKRKRLLLGSLALLTAAPGLLAAQSPNTPIAVRKLHSFGLRVSDVEASIDFYQRIFGAAILSRQGKTVCLQIGPGPRFFSIRQVETVEQPGITHIGLSVEDFSISKAQTQLENFGVSETSEPGGASGLLEHAMGYWETVRLPDSGGEPSGTRELFFQDVEGINYQLGPYDHCGGRGALGNVCDATEPSAYPGLFQLTDLSHFTTFVANKDRANDFYTKTFGKKFQAYQGPNFPVIGVGDGLQFLMYVGGAQTGVPASAGRIDHVCFNMTDFSVAGVLEELSNFGVTPRIDASDTQPLMHWVSMRMPARGGVEGGTPEVYFSDPDGIRIQLQAAGYCGGGGYLGERCPPL
jgi:catechol 2,3-dioxygenase-like lactoylglutathione lyase family enzyme